MSHFRQVQNKNQNSFEIAFGTFGSVTKSMPTMPQGLLGTPKGDNDEEPCLFGLA